MKKLFALLLLPSIALAQYQMTVRTQVTVPGVVLSPTADSVLSINLKAPMTPEFLITGFNTRALCEAYDPAPAFVGSTFDGFPVSIVITGTSCGKTP